MADYPAKQFRGTAQTLFNSSTDIAAGNFSAAGTNFTNNDSAVPACEWAEAMIEMPDWGAAPVLGTVVELWALPVNVDGTDDDTDAPSGTASNGAVFLCAFPLAAADALQRRTRLISMLGLGLEWTPYIRNGSAQNMNNDGGTNMVLKVTPIAMGITV
jgi:hypothetical protein